MNTSLNTHILNIHVAERLKSRMPYLNFLMNQCYATKVPENYDVQLAIPNGKKYLLWYTFLEDQECLCSHGAK